LEQILADINSLLCQLTSSVQRLLGLPCALLPSIRPCTGMCLGVARGCSRCRCTHQGRKITNFLG